jgi:hypothetical protein
MQLLSLLLALPLPLLCSSRSVTLSNTALPLDTAGHLLFTGELSVLPPTAAGRPFILYMNNWGGCPGVDCCPSPAGCASCCFATGYAPDPCVYTANHTVLAYSTPDFESFTPLGAALPPSERRNGTVFRPQVLFHSASSQYIMWYEDRWVGGRSNPGYAVAVSPSPGGPFSTVNASVVLGGKGRVGDFDLFLDEDGSAWHVRTGLSIQKLSASFLGPEGPAVDLPNGGVEGPALFKRQGVYYLLVGAGCCACKGGSNVVVYTALHLLGPWQLRGDVGSNSSSSHAFDAHSPLNYETHAQQSKVVAVPSASGELQYLWIGNQWVTSAQPGAPRDHDLLFFALLEFSEDGNITQMHWADSAQLSVP